MKTIGYITTWAIIGVFGTIWRGYVWSILWRWFIVSTFGLQPIGVAAAIGVSSTITFITFHYTPGKKDERKDSEKLLETIGLVFFYPLLVLGIGYIVKMFL